MRLCCSGRKRRKEGFRDHYSTIDIRKPIGAQSEPACCGVNNQQHHRKPLDLKGSAAFLRRLSAGPDCKRVL